MTARVATAIERHMRIRRGVTWQRGFRYTQRDVETGDQIDLDHTEWTAELAVRATNTARTEIVTLTSDPAAGLTLSTVDGSIQIAAVIDSDTTTDLAVNVSAQWTLALTLAGTDPPYVIELCTDQASVADTALEG